MILIQSEFENIYLWPKFSYFLKYRAKVLAYSLG